MNRQNRIIAVMALALAFCAGWILRDSIPSGRGLETQAHASGVALGSSGVVFTADQSGKLRAWNYDGARGDIEEVGQ